MKPTNPMFSIIMPCRLGPYPGAASNREEKLNRAIASVLSQTEQAWELVIIADGCNRTVELIEGMALEPDQVKLIKIPQQELWSGTPRNTGIAAASGTWIVYLDLDDFYGPAHLETIKQGLAKNQQLKWVYYNDFLALPLNRSKGKFLFDERTCNITKKGSNGTSNICHQRSLNIRWDQHPTYDHDWHFIRQLMGVSRQEEKPPQRIETPFYYCCHYPGWVDL